MSLISRGRGLVLAVLILAVASDGKGRVEGGGSNRRFISDRYYFSLMCPPKWLISTVDDTPIYFSFTPSQAMDFNHQLKMPIGGAVISVTVADRALGQPFNSLDEWARRDYEGLAEDSPVIQVFEMPSESTVKKAIVSAYDSATFAVGETAERRVTVFWEFRGKYFAAHLMYRARDKKALSFERVLFDVVRSFKPLGIKKTDK